MTTMTSPYPRRTKCPACDQWVCLSRGEGKFRHHGPKRNPCRASGRTFDEVAPPRSIATPEQLAALRYCWRIGDVKPVEDWLGETCLPYVPSVTASHCLEYELADLIAHARRWIAETMRARGITQ